MGLAPFRTRAVRLAAVCYSLLALLAIMVAAGTPVAGLDTVAGDWGLGLADEGSQRTWLWITALGGSSTVVPVMVVISLMFWRAGQQRLILPQWGGFLLARLVTDGLKHLMARQRPDITDLQQLLAGATSHAFPSGHATSGAYLYGLIALLILWSGVPRVAAWAWVLLLCLVIVAIALSRLVLGVHFASDVVGGLLSGLAALAVASGGLRLQAGSR